MATEVSSGCRTRPLEARRRFSWVLWLLAGLVPVPALAQPQERQLYVSVVDESGAPVTGLSAGDFVIREDGVQREVLRVAPATSPLQIALLVDTSQAATPHVKDIRDALTAFVTRMHEGNEIALIGFGERPTILVDYTSSPSALQAGINRIYGAPGSGSYLLDAMVNVLEGFQRRDAERPVMIVVTTQGIEYSNRDDTSVLRALREARVPFHAVVIEEGRSPNPMNDNDRYRNLVLDQGTTLSGGRRENLLTSLALDQALQELAAELENQYLLVYARPEALLPPERLDVEVTRPGATARAFRMPGRTE